MQRVITYTLCWMVNMLLLVGSVAAATVSRPTTINQTTLVFKPILIKPQITQVSPTSCVKAGDTVTISGSNFGTGSGRSLALINGGATVASIASLQTSWTQSKISLSFPTLSQLKPKLFYAIGIVQTGGSMLSNTDKGITLCATSSKSITLSPALSTLGFKAKTSSGTPTPPGENPAMGAATQGMGGSLLQGQFPPPPQDVSPPPPKEDKTIEPHELLVLSDNLKSAQALLAKARALGLGVKRRSVLKGLGFVMTVLHVPKQESSGKALLRLRKAMPKAWADVNHRYQLQGKQGNSYGRRMLGWKNTGHCRGRLRIGLLDTKVAVEQPVLRGRAITQHSFLAAGITPAPPNHATAIAALLVAAPQASGLAGLVPHAHLYIAGIFRNRDGKHVDTTAEWVVRGLDWLVQQKVNIANLSLGGPRNLLVEAAIQRVLKRGVAVVAAAGNGGNAGAAVYPAAQAGVVAVTAIDVQRAIYKYATHGDYIAFSAPGVDVWTAAPDKGGVYVSGTSYAVPFVTAALANAHLAIPAASWSTLENKLEKNARDLGQPGKDPVFGWGLVQSLSCHHTARNKH